MSSKTVNDVHKYLKLRATPRENVLFVKVGLKRIAVPIETKLCVSENFLFVHIPPGTALLNLKDGTSVSTLEQAMEAQKSFRKPKSEDGRHRRSHVLKLDVPNEIHDALSKIPKGYKLVIGPTGTPRIVKARVRTKKA